MKKLLALAGLATVLFAAAPMAAQADWRDHSGYSNSQRDHGRDRYDRDYRRDDRSYGYRGSYRSYHPSGYYRPWRWERPHWRHHDNRRYW